MYKRLLSFFSALLVLLALTACNKAPASSSMPEPDVMPPAAISVPDANSFDEKLKLPGAVGWLEFAGTTIDDVVMQAQDNEYYLRRDETGQQSVWGCYYLDFECPPDGPGPNTIIYGHSFEDTAQSERFSQLKLLNNPNFTSNNRTITLLLNGTQYTYTIFSAGYASALTDTVAITANPTEEEMRQIIEGALARSVNDFGVDVDTGDKLLTLSTCTSDDDTRYVVTAKLDREELK